MSHLLTTNVDLGGADAMQQDGFGTLRVSNKQNIFVSSMEYDDDPFKWDTVTANGGTWTHSVTESVGRLAVTTVSGSKVTRQTRKYFKYQPGKSQIVYMTAAFAPTQVNVAQRMGMFDDNDGIFFNNSNGNVVGICIRTSTSGSPVDNNVLQPAWNIDKLDGTGASGYTIDATKTQIYFFDYQWLGVGKLRFGVMVDGEHVICHEQTFENTDTVPYMSTGSLPIRLELENIAGATSGSTMTQLCASVSTDGGNEIPAGGVLFNASRGTTPGVADLTNDNVIFALRPKATYNGRRNKLDLYPVFFQIFTATSGKDIYYEFFLNGTVVGTPVWTSAHPFSGIEYSTTAVTHNKDGFKIYSGYTSQGLPGEQTIKNIAPNPGNFFTLGNNIDNTQLDTLYCVVRNLTSGTANVFVSMGWMEFK